MDIPYALTMENLLDVMNTAVVVVSREYHILYMNVAAELMLGTSRRMAQRKGLFNTFPRCNSIHAQIHKVLETQRVYSERNLEVQLDDQRKMTLDSTITPVLNDELITEYMVIELTQIDRRLRIAREGHLVSQSEGVRDLLRGVAHEIKNPLGGIRGAAQLLAGELLSPDYHEYTDIIIHETERLQSFVDCMLGPRRLPRMAFINIHEVLENTRKLALAEAGSHLSIRVDYDPSLSEIKADRGMLQQAFLNLVNNAMQAVQGLDPAIITIRTRSEHQFTINHIRHRLGMKIEIIDTGPGIPAEMQEIIFLPMVTNKSEGTGLGLPIAQSLIQYHGGLIEYDVRGGKTCFVVYLPLETRHAGDE